MTTDIALERCKSFIDCQLRSAENRQTSSPNIVSRPAITVSRQTGSGAHILAEKLAAFLDKNDIQAPFRWTVFDKNLVAKVLEDHHLPRRFGRFIREDVKSSIHDAVEEMLGLHPSRWTLIEQTTDTIFRLAQMGNVILVGRGSAIIAQKLPNAFHVRLVGSIEQRSARVQEQLKLKAKEAMDFIQKEEHNRKHYLKSYFGEDIDNPLLYHLTINTDVVGCDEAAQLVGKAVLARISSVQMP